MANTLVVNLFGGPGVAKSTTAAGLFYHLKTQGISCELITEYAKDRTWLKDYETLACQPYVTAKQLWRMERVVGQVDVMITDSPLLFGIIYAGKWGSENFDAIVNEWFDRFNNLNFLLTRDLDYHPYRQAGRTQTVDEAIVVDGKIEALLNDFSISHERIKCGKGSTEKILQTVLERLRTA